MGVTESIMTHREAVKREQATRGMYHDVTYTPVFRSAAIFFVWVGPGIDTWVSFMNYWREKNGNAAVSALLTLRTADGQTISRDFFTVDQFTYQFSVRDLVKSQATFTGSLEVELFSTQDLKFSYPALEMFYVSPAGVSFVHSNQRVYNSVDDMDRNASLNPWQTGFDIAVNERYTSYLTLVNGPRPVHDSTALLKVYNASGEALEAVIPLGDLPPYASRLVLLDDVPSIRTFLGQETGFCKVTFDAFGVFLRIACGILARDRSRVEVTHSYYDCNHHGEYYDTSEVSDEEYACFFPFSLLDGVDLDLVFYPIYAKSILTFSLDSLAPDGERRARIERFATLDSHGTRMLRVNVRQLLNEHGLDPAGGLYCLHLHSADGRIPTRVALGVNYRRGFLGCNINSSMVMSPSYGIRKRLYRWGPLMWTGEGDNWIVVSHLNKIQGAREEAQLRCTIFGTTGRICEKTYRTTSGAALQIHAETLMAGAAYLPRRYEVLWYTLESDCPNYLSNQIHLSQSGFVGGDHSF